MSHAFAHVRRWHTFVNLDGSLSTIADAFGKKGLALISEIWPSTSPRAWQLLGAYALFEALLQVYLPGKPFKATMTANGNVPVYKANGVQSLVVTVVAFFACWRFGLTSPKEVYDLFGEMLAGMAIFSVFFCVFLQIKGHVAPTDEDSGSCGNPIYDFFIGRELNPRIGSFDLKFFCELRPGLIGWTVLNLGGLPAPCKHTHCRRCRRYRPPTWLVCSPAIQRRCTGLWRPSSGSTTAQP